MKKKAKHFNQEDQEREFWSKADSTRYINWKKGRKVVFPNLKPSSKTISLRLPEIMLAELKMLANKKDVPYQSLVKIYIAEMLKRELYSNRTFS
ncbi:MAG: BrnA antitoxin family protein [candidate division FCPU426 bacterium]